MMVREFVFTEGCVIIDNIRVPREVAAVLGGLGCSFTGWSALAVHAGSKLLIPYHPSYLEIACPSLEVAIRELRGFGLVVWRGRRWATVGWVYRPLRVALGELRVFEESVVRAGERCGLGVASIEDAVRHVIIFREHVRDLRLLGAYSNGRVTVTKAMIRAVRDQVRSLIFNASAKTL